MTDAENHTTTYQYDDMGRMVSATSPDTGVVAYSYDEAGNLLNKTDNKGIAVAYVYDALSRLTAVHFPDQTQDVDYSYDAGTDGMGRETGMADQSGTVSFGYDNRGRLASKTSLIDGISYPLSRTYTSGGRVSSMTYPTGRTVDYHRTACACSVDSVTTTLGGNTVTLMQNLSYRPFGGAKAMDTGAGGSITSLFDDAGRQIVANPGADKETSYTYDNNGNLASIAVPATPWCGRTFSYDALDRLTHAEAPFGPFGIMDYTYDGVGNRLTRTQDGVSETYAYAPGTNLLESVTNTETVTYSHDANGNITGIGDRTLTYNQDNRLIRVEEGGATLGEYTYNGLGQRIIKTAGGATTVFHYDFDGQLIGESDLTGNFTKEYIYRGKGLLALMDVSSGEMFYYGNDKLGTPQILTDSTNTLAWEAYYKPFGDATVNPNSGVESNLRFSGQYYDAETGLHYNYFRYYDPQTGRYLSPDPIRQLGGINLYIYALNNPINSIDPLGLRGLTVAEYYAKFEGALKSYIVAGGLVVTGAATTVAGVVLTVSGYGSMPVTGPAGALVGTAGLVVTGAGVGQMTLGLDVYADELRHRLGLPEWFDIIRHFELIKHEFPRHLKEGECE